MDDNQIFNDNQTNNENASNLSERREKKISKREEAQNVQNNNFFSYFIEAMSNDKLDTDKIKALISLEQNIYNIKEKYK